MRGTRFGDFDRCLDGMEAVAPKTVHALWVNQIPSDSNPCRKPVRLNAYRNTDMPKKYNGVILRTTWSDKRWQLTHIPKSWSTRAG